MGDMQICGLRQTHLFLIIVIVALAIGSIVGGIVGGRKASSKNLASNNDQATQEPAA